MESSFDLFFGDGEENCVNVARIRKSLRDHSNPLELPHINWESDTQPEKFTYISHNVTNFEFLYEPFYIALDNVPAHDERFLGYGFTRNSQVYEMYISGYEFYVLSPVFTCHWGLQIKKSRPTWREQQNNVNRKRFEAFKNEIFARYGNNRYKKLKNS